MTEVLLDIGEAVDALKAGHRVARQGWNGQKMWLRKIDPYVGHPRNPYFKAMDNNALAIGTMAPWIGMKTADNQFVPWQCSQTDLLAEDWVIVPVDAP